MDHIIIETLLDTIKAIPFLFICYLLLEYISSLSQKKEINLNNLNKFGPFLGAVAGLIPQCGFSAAMSNLYSTGIITRGTLIAVFLSTSDEMLPILVSRQADPVFIIKALLYKFVVGALMGIIVDIVASRFGKTKEKHIHDMCEREGCKCEDGILKSAIIHTVKIFAFIVIVTFVLNYFVHSIGEEKLANFIMNKPVIGQVLAGLVGLVPNCASSVVLTELYLQGALSAGAMMSGLLVSSGVGLIILFRMNRDLKDNLFTLAILYISGVFFGLLLDIIPIF